MASTIIVFHLNDYTKCSIKVTPSTTLRSIAEQACQTFKLPGSVDQYGLKRPGSKSDLDLSLSVRFAALPSSGCKLELIRRRNGNSDNNSNGQSQSNLGSQSSVSKSAPVPSNAQVVEGVATIALQLSDQSSRLIHDFPVSMTLWQILVQTDSRSAQLNLTRRTGPASSSEQPSSPLSPSPFLPLKKFIRKVDTALNNLVHYQRGEHVYFAPILVFMNREIAGVDELRRCSLKSLGIKPGSKNLLRVMFRETDVAAGDIDALLAAIDEIDAAPGTDVLPATPLLPEQPTETKPSAEPATASNDMDTSESNITENETDAFPKQIAVSEHEQIIPSEPELTEPYDHKVRIYRIPQETTLANKINLPEDFYQLTPAELKYEIHIQQQKRKAIDSAPFMTKSMRDKQDFERRQRQERSYPKCLLRIRFPDDIAVVEMQFLSTEKFSTVLAELKRHLHHSLAEAEWWIYTTPPLYKLNKPEQLDSTLMDLNFVPATLLYFGTGADVASWQPDVEGGSKYLNREAMSLAQDMPRHPSQEVQFAINAMPMPAVEQSSSSQSVPYDSDRGEETYRNRSMVIGDERQQQEEKKVPKWLRLSKK